MKVAAAIAFAALFAACSRSGPVTTPSSTSAAGTVCSPFSARFSARVSGPEGRVRLRGIVAVAGGARLRVEAAGPSVAAPILLVAVQDDLSVLLAADRLFYRGSDGHEVFEKALGVAVRPAAIATLLSGESSQAPDGCDLSVGRKAGCGPGAEAPTRLTLRCAGAKLDLSLEEIRPLAPREGADPFAPLAPRAGDRIGGVEDLAAALRPSS
jgi:hypothetical protein